MKEFFVTLLLVLIPLIGFVAYQGVSHQVQFHYVCGVEVPWYDAFFLDTDKCPNHS